jgi:hypothetical protein
LYEIINPQGFLIGLIKYFYFYSLSFRLSFSFYFTVLGDIWILYFFFHCLFVMFVSNILGIMCIFWFRMSLENQLVNSVFYKTMLKLIAWLVFNANISNSAIWWGEIIYIIHLQNPTMSDATSGQDYLFFPNLIVRTRSLAN